MRYLGLELLESLQRRGKKTFSTDEAVSSLRLSQKSVLGILGRLRRSKRIVTLTNGLYAILHPTEQKHGPRPWDIIDALMRYQGLTYYVGLLSAADYWGAAHHKPQVLQVIVSENRRLRRLEALKIELHLQRAFPKRGITERIVDTGPVPVSSPELTALDLLTYPHACGGFDNVCLVVGELVGQIDYKKILAMAKNYSVVASAQRLGFFLERLGATRELTQGLREWIKKRKPSRVLLHPASARKGRIHPDWNVDENVEVDLEP